MNGPAHSTEPSHPDAGAAYGASATAPPPPPHAVHAAPGQDPRTKSPALAGVLSLIPGLGQVYTGYYQRGFVHALVVAGLISVLASIGPGDEETFVPLGVLFLIFFWMYNVIDAIRRASLYNQYLAGLEQIDLPREFPALGRRGSLGVGLVLIAGGSLLLAHTRWEMSLAWVAEWWPLAPILLGVWLVVRAIQDRNPTTGSSGQRAG